MPQEVALWPLGTKAACTDLFASIVSSSGLADPLASPLQLPKRQVTFEGTGVSVTTVPARYVPPGGESSTLPPPVTPTVRAKLEDGAKLAETVLSASTVSCCGLVVPPRSPAKPVK